MTVSCLESPHNIHLTISYVLPLPTITDGAKKWQVATLSSNHLSSGSRRRYNVAYGDSYISPPSARGSDAPVPASKILMPSTPRSSGAAQISARSVFRSRRVRKFEIGSRKPEPPLLDCSFCSEFGPTIAAAATASQVTVRLSCEANRRWGRVRRTSQARSLNTRWKPGNRSVVISTYHRKITIPDLDCRRCSRRRAHRSHPNS
ncbi:hypothetical protein BV25DRAFT_1221464 [Artomyces pyxidatus]|uniref:Uncharacterized protein n=1 Tax=Artomyces pyxidatus TaxID=48021 RepID=A0ACB8SQ02_9AGAM|nr:hypothetical protein BV25DRAFT_1221464 [Artomyces pyxidatus]